MRRIAKNGSPSPHTHTHTHSHDMMYWLHLLVFAFCLSQLVRGSLFDKLVRRSKDVTQR